MHWRFEQLFTIKVLHQNILDNPPIDPAGYAYEFGVVPALSSANRFQQLSWIAKPIAGGIMVFGEKTIRPDGTDFVRVSPRADEVFTFYLQLKRPAILDRTKPFAINGNSNLPNYSGRARIVYLNDQSITTELNAEGDTIHRLTPDSHISVADLGSRGQTPFLFQTEDAARRKVVASPIISGSSAPQTFEVPADNRSVELKLAENAWDIEQQPQGSAELMYLSERPLPSDVFGIIQIINTGEWIHGEFRRYQALFDRAG